MATRGDDAVVTVVNDIDPLIQKLKDQKLDVDIATSDSNSLLWRTPQ